MIKSLLKRLIIKSIGVNSPLSLVGNNYQIPSIVISCKDELANLPNVYCNINFDDQSPVYRQIDGRDYGGKIKTGITKKLELFLEQNPDVAITSFVIPNFKGNTRHYKDKFLLTNPDYSEWISYYSNLAKKYNLEFALHGYYHLQKENPFFQPHTEFAFKSNEQTIKCIGKGMDVFKKIGWPITGFRQPGWDLSSAINLPQIAENLDLKYIAANSYNAGYNAGGIERISNYYPTIIDGIINFPQNIELDWPIDEILKKIDFLVEIKAIISIKAHFVDRNVCNCLNEENFIKLNRITDYVRTKFINRIEFATFKDVYEKLAKSKAFLENYANNNI